MAHKKIYKDKFGIWVTQPREYIELTNDARDASEARMEAQDLRKRPIEQGLRKRPIDLPGGFKSFTWERFREPTAEELEAASRGCPTPGESIWRKEMPAPSERAKPVGMTHDGPKLDDGFDWTTVFDNLDRMGTGQSSAWNPSSPKPQPAPSHPQAETPSIPEAVLRAQERDASSPTPKAPSGEHPWPWGDKDLYGPREELPSLDDALNGDYDF